MPCFLYALSITRRAEGLASLEHEFSDLQRGGYAHSIGVFLIISVGLIPKLSEPAC